MIYVLQVMLEHIKIILLLVITIEKRLFKIIFLIYTVRFIILNKMIQL